MKATTAGIEEVLRTLEESPSRISRAAQGLGKDRLHFSPDAKTWSAAEVLAHLRACADIWVHSMYAMLAEQNPILPDINERKWAKAARYAELPFADSLQVFSLQRAGLSRVLKELPFESWERSGVIFERKHTVFSQARRLARHEVEHCQGIELLLKR